MQTLQALLPSDANGIVCSRATQEKRKIITQALVIIKLGIKTKRFYSADPRAGVLSATNGVYFTCGVSGLQAGQRCPEEGVGLQAP